MKLNDVILKKKKQKQKIIEKNKKKEEKRRTKKKKKKTAKNTNSWKLNNMPLNNQWIIEEIKEEIKRYLETNDNEDTTTQNIWNTAKAVLRGKFIAIQSYLRKEEKTHINNLTLHLKHLEKEDQTKAKISRRKEIIKIRAEINNMETRKTIEESNETKAGSLKDQQN